MGQLPYRRKKRARFRRASFSGWTRLKKSWIFACRSAIPCHSFSRSICPASFAVPFFQFRM